MNKNIAEIPTLERLCYHEAGHAILEFLLGYSITSIKVHPSEGWGLCSYDYQPDVKSRTPELSGIPEIGRRILIHCGGSASLSALIGVKQDWHRSSDYIKAVDELALVYKDPKIIATYIQSTWRWVKRLLSQDQNWHAVEALAYALIWHFEETDNEDWYGSDTEELLPSDFYKTEPWLRVMDGEEAEEIIWRALTQTP